MTEKLLTRVCATSEIEDQGAKRVVIPGKEPIAVCRLGDKFYALADTCSHGLASLCDGDIEDGQIFCPFHGGAFDIATGKPTERPCTIPVKVYPVVVRDNEVFVDPE